ncbi:MAG TPA: cytochrome-c oxidase [Casimicrobiaceae bacterium]|nr:cytochrome-c oxidase [Casimicrobiaceae bacterium]
MGMRFIKIAVLYFAVGVSIGLAMGMTGQFTFMPVHAHINLLGWASLALCGLIYTLYPEAAQTRLAKTHFWLHNVGLPPLMVALAFLLSGHPGAEPVVGVLSMVVGVGILMFVVNVWLTLKPQATSQAAMRSAAPAGAR